VACPGATASFQVRYFNISIMHAEINKYSYACTFFKYIYILCTFDWTDVEDSTSAEDAKAEDMPRAEEPSAHGNQADSSDISQVTRAINRNRTPREFKCKKCPFLAQKKESQFVRT